MMLDIRRCLDAHMPASGLACHLQPYHGPRVPCVVQCVCSQHLEIGLGRLLNVHLEQRISTQLLSVVVWPQAKNVAVQS